MSITVLDVDRKARFLFLRVLLLPVALLSVVAPAWAQTQPPVEEHGAAVDPHPQPGPASQASTVDASGDTPRGVLAGAVAGASRHRPRIALVLEGGGALGFAHIGVIEYLEQHHIPIDLVVGTSMGGLVGGLYASGRSPEEIRTLVKEIDWDSAIGGRTPFRDLAYRRKEDRIAYPNRFEFGLKHGLSAPEGLNSGQQVGLILDRATLPDFGLKNFDELPIPFRCVATNMNTGRAQVFDSGSLAQALRATMSIPGLFAPIVINGVTFTDGGAVDNLPVDVAKANHADIVIASYLDAGPPGTTRTGSFLSTAGATISIMIAANELRSIEQADILIRSDVKGFAALMFADSAAIIPKGVEGAQSKASLLDRLAVDDAEWAEYVKERSSRRRTEIPKPQFVTVAGADKETNAEMHSIVAPEVVNKKIDLDRLDQQMTRFVGYGALNAAGYAITQQNGQPGLAVTAYPKSTGPPFLNLAVTIDGSDTQDVLFGMSGRITFNNLGGYRAEWRTDAFFGYSYGVTSEYYKPFTAESRWFYAPRAYVTSTRFDFYNNGSKVSQYQIDQNGFGFDAGYTSPRGAELRVGQDEYWYSVKKRIDFDDLSIPATRQDVTSLRFNYLGADNAVLPLSGVNTSLRIERHEPSDQSDPFTLAEAKIGTFYPITKSDSLILRASGGTSFGAPPLTINLQGFPLGGPFNLGSYGRNELLGNEYWLLQGGYERKLFGFNPLLGSGLYALGLMEGGKVYQNLNAADALVSEAYDGSVAAVARTSLGTLFVGGAIGNNSHRKWWFGLGRVF